MQEVPQMPICMWSADIAAERRWAMTKIMQQAGKLSLHEPKKNQRRIPAMWSADMMVERRWAMTRVVRPAMSRSRAPCTSLSDSLSKALVASSSRSTCSGIASHAPVIQAPCTRQTGVMHTLSGALSNALVALSRSNTCSKVSTTCLIG